VPRPTSELGVEVGQAIQVLAVESRAVQLLESGALEALVDGVVVGEHGGKGWWRMPQTGRRPVMAWLMNFWIARVRATG
jgi:hypothetical protein